MAPLADVQLTVAELEVILLELGFVGAGQLVAKLDCVNELLPEEQVVITLQS